MIFFFFGNLQHAKVTDMLILNDSNFSLKVKPMEHLFGRFQSFVASRMPHN